MDKILKLMILSIFLVSLLGCQKEKTSVFIGKVIQNDGNTLLVEPKITSIERSSADRFTISLKDTKILNNNGEEIDINQIEVGSYVKIEYNGLIAESYPAKINKCYKITLT